LLGFDTNQTKLLFENSLTIPEVTTATTNIILFIVVQTIQQPVITTSLKIGLPKVVLASIVTSRG
jgi:hypothetical protein